MPLVLILLLAEKDGVFYFRKFIMLEFIRFLRGRPTDSALLVSEGRLRLIDFVKHFWTN